MTSVGWGHDRPGLPRISADIAVAGRVPDPGPGAATTPPEASPRSAISDLGN